MAIVPVSGVRLPVEIPAPTSVKPVGESGSASFGSVLAESLSQVEHVQTAANQSVERFLSGEGEELHQTAIAVQKAEITFDLFLQVRNKVLQAYQDIMHMQV